MRIPRWMWKKSPEVTAESVILGELQRARAMYPVMMMPSTIINSLNNAGFVIISEADLDAEIALAFQAGEEEGRGK